jgi:hypothetical protein
MTYSDERRRNVRICRHNAHSEQGWTSACRRLASIERVGFAPLGAGRLTVGTWVAVVASDDMSEDVRLLLYEAEGKTVRPPSQEPMIG